MGLGCLKLKLLSPLCVWPYGECECGVFQIYILQYAPIILPVSISETGAWANTAAEMCVGIIRSKFSLEISWRTWLVKQQSFLKFRPILSKRQVS